MHDNVHVPLVLVGQGRLGGPLARALQDAGQFYVEARLDPDDGLPGALVPATIEHLVVVVSNRAREGAPAWQWHHLFAGLLLQAERGDLRLQRITMVSSTRVYDGIARGFVDAATEPKPLSDQAKSLCMAELHLQHLSRYHHVLRPAGLYGGGYTTYEPVLHAATDRPRFGVSADAVIQRLLTLCLTPPANSTSEILTDGKCYFNNRAWPASRKQPEMVALAGEHRILLPSVHIPES